MSRSRTPHTRARGRKSALAVLLAASFAAFLATMAFGVAGASALTAAKNCALQGSEFQGGDGNQQKPSEAEEIFCLKEFLATTRDWQSDAAKVTNSPDPNALDSVFKSGKKESEPGKWELITEAGGASPPKTNILSAWSEADIQSAATFLYLAFEREATTGDTFLTFELNQVKGLWENENKAMIPCRTTGDVLIAYNVQAGAVKVTIYHWTTLTSKKTSTSEDPTEHQCAKTGEFDAGTLVSSPNAQGEMNFSEEITNYLEDTAKKEIPSKFAAGSFGEAALNLTAIFKNASLGPCFSFGQLSMSSRSSESIESSLQDYVSPVGILENSCSISGRKFDDVNGSKEDLPSKPGLAGWTIELLDSSKKPLQTITTAKDGTYTFTNVKEGTYFIRETSQSGWACDFPGTGTKCEYEVKINSSTINSTGNDFGNVPTSKVTTTQEPASGAVGSKFGDSATVSGPATGGAPTPTGEVEFTLYSEKECKGVVAGPIKVALSGGKAAIPTASKVTLSTTGTYYWAATYGGDEYNAKAVSGCNDEPVTVEKAKPTIATQLSANPIAIDTAAHDSATLTGASANAGGTVDYRYYSSEAACETAASAFTGANASGGTDVGSVTVTNGSVPDSLAVTFHNAGTYYWAAFYSGDSNNKAAVSGCGTEKLVVKSAGPSISTQLSASPIAIDSSAHDSATLSGASANAGGTVDYRYYASEAECKTAASAFTGANASGGTDVGSVTVTNGSVPDSLAVTFHNAGTYYWAAFYSGDSNNAAAVSGCGTELLVVNQAKPTISTELSANPIAIDTAAHDSATLTGASANAGGTVDYRYYASEAECKTAASAFTGANASGGTDVGSVSVTNGSVPDSLAVTFHNAGTYFWAAFYSGDSNNAAAVSGCGTELLVVNQAKPTIATKLSANPIAIDTATHDSATLTGASANAGGTVDYRYYASETECEADASAFPGTPVGGTDVGSVTVTNGAVPDSPSVTFHNAGTYYWAAFYSGDGNNEPAVSGCGTEKLVVKSAGPSISTELSANPIAIDTAAHDSATLTGASANAGGTVDYRYYASEADCETAALVFTGANASGGTDVGSVTVTNGSVPNSTSVTFHNAGTYYWAAFYSGDSNNKAAVSGCGTELLVVNQATPTISTKLSANPIAIDAAAHDSATLSGASANAGGTVDYRYYASETDCETAASAFTGANASGGTDVGSVTVTNGSVPDSLPVTFHNAGTYYWAAFYSGDSNNTAAVSGCGTELLVVNQASPTIATKLSANPIAIDTAAHDSATLTGASANAGGTVDYRYYASEAECKTAASAFTGANASGGTDVGSVTVTNGSVPDSLAVTFHNAGTYYWAAFYSGDSNNKAAVSGCGTELLVVNEASPTIATKLSANPIAIDTAAHDSATLSGASANAGGTVDYRFYASQADCGTAASAFTGANASGGTDVGSVTVTNGSVPDSLPVTFHNAGTYYWAAFYSGDSNNEPAVSGCGTELLVVNKATPSISTRLSASPIAIDTAAHDSASLSGASANAGGTVDYRFYSSEAACESDATVFPGITPVGGTDVGSVTVTNGSVPDSLPVTFHNAGTYYWAAFYSGDGNNEAAVSGCGTEKLVVKSAGPSISTQLSASPIAIDTAAHDSATLTGASANAGGEVDYRYYASEAECNTDATAFPGTGPVGGTDVGSVTVTNGSVPASASITFHNAGTYYWAAFYSGDGNNEAAVSGCGTELLVVNQATPTISTKLSASPIAIDAAAHDSATLSGASANAGGTVDYRYYGSEADCETAASAFTGANASGGTDVGSVTVSNGSVPDSLPVTFHNAGTYYWAAFYSGDSNNTFAVSGCGTEKLVVKTAGPSISTQLSANPIAIDTAAHDSAALTGASANGGGEVDYRYYASQVECETAASAFTGGNASGGTDVGSVTVTNGSVPDSLAITFHNAGTYYWAAFYSGDGNNEAAVSGCGTELLVVNQATPTISTKLSASPIAIDTAAHDSATLAGASENAGGMVDYRYYASISECEADEIAFPGTPVGGTDVGSVSVTNGSVPDSLPVTFHNAGAYYWAAFYSGDGNNTAAVSGCGTELLVVNQASPTIATQLSANPIAIDTAAHDSATLAGASANAGGTVDYRYYASQAECETAAAAFTGSNASGGIDVGSVTVTNGLVPDSSAVTFHNAGTYFWAAFYSGDSNNADAVSGCGTELLVVNKAAPSISTKLSASPIAIDTAAHDSATLTGASANAGGTVDYRYYANEAECQTAAAAFTGANASGGTDVGSVTVTNGSVPDSLAVTFHNAGTYYWAAFYSGDSNNVAAVSGCGTELLVVSQASPTISTKLSANPIAIDTAANDTATLTGASANAGGTVDYRYYASEAECETAAAAFTGANASGGTDVGSVTVTNGSVPASGAVTFHNAGTYYWAAFYSGDSNNADAVSGCGTELLVVNQAKPSISTQLSANPIAIDTAAHDSATLTGASANAGGSVDYRYYASQAECENAASAFTGANASGGTDVGSVTVTNGSVPSSADVTFHNAGTYYWAAFYSGDKNNVAAVSGCGTELLVVNKAAPFISTKLSASPIAIDTAAHDSATLTGASANAGGTVDYRYYASEAECEADASAFPGTPVGGTDVGPVTVANGLVPNSADVTFHNAGTYYWAAFYSGDGNNEPAVSGCGTEKLVVKLAGPSISTQLSANPIAIDTAANDTATLTAASANAGGTVDYRYYASQAECETAASAFTGANASGGIDVGSVTVTNGSVPASGSVTFHNAGTYYWAAFYSGDKNNEPAVSGCGTELLVVNQATPTIATKLSANPIAIDTAAHDSATLTGASANAGGTVDYRYYASEAECNTAASAFTGANAAGGTDVGTVTVTNGSVPDSTAVTFHNAGTYFWAAFYSGDKNNVAAVSGCGTELLVVNQAKPTIATQLSANPIAIDTAAHDSATLTGASANAGGTVDYRYYGSEAECKTAASAFTGANASGGTDVGTVTVTNGSVPNSADVTFHNAGTYFWAAFYSGDKNNVAAVSGCGTELLVVNKAAPSISTKLSASPIAIDTAAHDTATLHNASLNAGGTVDYRYYASEADCKTAATAFTGANASGGTDVGTVTVTNGSVPASASVTFHNAGTYYWAAFYSGDSNNVAAVSGCGTELLVVNPASPTITTQLSASPIAIDTAAHDSATLTGASANAGGTVDYRYYASEAECIGALPELARTNATPRTNVTGGTDVGTVTVTNGLVPSSPDVTFHNAGTYYWAAIYSGDSNNEPAASGCDTELLVVNQAKPAISTTASGSVVYGGSLHDTAHLTGGSANIAGKIVFKLYAASDTSCATVLKTVETEVGKGNGDYESPSVTVGVGSYQWVAEYSGDQNNVAASTSCNDPNEQASVTEHPGIAVVKEQQIAGSGQPFTTAPLEAKVGQQINYRITVTNTGDVALALSFSDPHCDAGTITGPTGNLNPDGTLPAGGVAQYFCSHVMQAGDAPQLTNAATVTGQPPSGPPVSATGSVVVNVAKAVVEAKCTLALSSIKLHGAGGSRRKPFTVSISSLGIQQITFYLDKHKIKTLTQKQAKHGQYTIKIDPRKLRYGAHTVSIKTVMTDKACAALARSGVFVHPRPPVVKPKFTG